MSDDNVEFTGVTLEMGPPDETVLTLNPKLLPFILVTVEVGEEGVGFNVTTGNGVSQDPAAVGEVLAVVAEALEGGAE